MGAWCSQPDRGRPVPGAQAVSGRSRATAPTWTGASGCSCGGVPPRSGAASASPPSPPSPRTCGRPHPARAPPPPPLPLRRATETPHPPNPTARPLLQRQPLPARQKEPDRPRLGPTDLHGLCRLRGSSQHHRDAAAASTTATRYQATAGQPVTRETRLRLLPAFHVDSELPPTRMGLMHDVTWCPPLSSPLKGG
jgi:hypothetical protein